MCLLIHFTPQRYCLDGVRFLSMCWVILGHTTVFQLFANVTEPTSMNPIHNPVYMVEVWTARWTFQLIVGGFFAVDSFFLISYDRSTPIFHHHRHRHLHLHHRLRLHLHRHRQWHLTRIRDLQENKWARFEMEHVAANVSKPLSPSVAFVLDGACLLHICESFTWFGTTLGRI